ncbi:hypothetical protein PoB_002608100 [Plakobranchus ocellatus]|uniref:Uncharacterized protein n=1 Tax=Plakobranchus ocellatus TaxID=259542 RepID=A0AAV3ZKB8_9GAST|nr:hypothetical protein PoB_002608100 [Plakobranchus ocellatus]
MLRGQFALFRIHPHRFAPKLRNLVDELILSKGTGLRDLSGPCEISLSYISRGQLWRGQVALSIATTWKAALSSKSKGMTKDRDQQKGGVRCYATFCDGEVLDDDDDDENDIDEDVDDDAYDGDDDDDDDE